MFEEFEHSSAELFDLLRLYFLQTSERKIKNNE
jgi:hypothetical protein